MSAISGIGPATPFTPDLAQDYVQPRIDRSDWGAACLARPKGTGALQDGSGAFCCLGAAQAAFGSASPPSCRLVGIDLRSCEQHVVDRIGIEPGSAAERLLIGVNDRSEDWAPVVRIIAGLPTRRLSGADLRNAGLRNADLSGADLSGADLSGADLSGADLSDADLVNADLRNADLRNADLRGADLRDADLRNADLRDADLRDADLSCADLSGADLRDADLVDADLRHADLSGAIR